MVDTSNTSNTKKTEAKPRKMAAPFEKMAVKETKKASLKPADEKPSCILRILVTGRWLMAFAVVFFYGTWYLVDCFCDYVKSSMPRKVQEVEYSLFFLKRNPGDPFLPSLIFYAIFLEVTEKSRNFASVINNRGYGQVYQSVH